MHYRDDINEIADICRRDPAFIIGIKDALLTSGLASICGLRIDETKLDPFRPCPTNWAAMQIAFFDNGEIPPSRNRPKIQRTKMRYGANIMVWDREGINFRDRRQVAWQANIYLWAAEEARQIVRDLRDEKYVGDETVEMIDEATEDAAENLRFSIPLFKVGTGTRWMRSHVVITILEDERPAKMLIQFPDADVIVASEPMADYLPDGQALSGKAILQARLARDPSLGQWMTQHIQ
jgi:hypothetical protein